MKKALVAAIAVMAAGEPCLAQTATGVGVGTGIANSRSQSTAVAVSGQGGAGGAGGTGGSPTAAVTIQGTQQPAVATQNLVTSGTTTVRSVPSVFAPGLAAAGLETCLGSASGGASFVGTGLTFGTSVPDPSCSARLDARTLWSFGLKRAALARLCLSPEIRQSMPDICGTYLPQPVPVGYPAPVVAPARYAEAEPYAGGPIMLVEGATGKDRLCNDYDTAHKRCRKWDGVVSHTSKRKVASPTLAATTPAKTAENSEGK